ncbi:hypothetical protein [Leuconostoc mesenteroides]|uniref:hypothetical protein n=1 Tax=Leuconostoc mesenteroides TaxID=1245 RepID=UPI0023620A95|nr:hypothetical protein [Leuconostoc mesenteroides]
MTKKQDSNVMVELSQFMVAAIIIEYAQFNEDNELITDADEYNSIVVEGTPVDDGGDK